MKDEEEKKKKKDTTESVAQSTSRTASPVGFAPVDAGAYQARAAADEKAAKAAGEEERARKNREALAARNKGQQAADDDPEPQSKDFPSIVAYAGARRAWLKRRAAKAESQKKALEK